MTDVEKLAKILSQSSSAVFFGGAGMSTESGIPDFRSANGIYNQKLNQTFSPEEMASHNFFVNHPEEFFAFYRARFVYLNAAPNAGHIALAELERRGNLSAVVTQNIDGLHQIAGSKVVYELHGSIRRSYCVKCGAKYGVEFVMENIPVPHCEKCGGIVKPDVVLYGENLDNETVSNSIRAIAAADTLIVGGTSLIVYPAAGLIDYFRGRHLVLINKTATHADTDAELVIRENIGATLSKAVALLS
ncbi:MAG: NAD-dependent protein deacylase [Selenomonadaceae bacterium]|nr:NAD-dependent protein deacylase [Selenomonadaceae bacterium]